MLAARINSIVHMAPTVKPGIGYIDAIITKVALCTLPTWRAAGFTPNGLTTLGLVCTVATLAATYRALLGGTAGAEVVVADPDGLEPPLVLGRRQPHAHPCAQGGFRSGGGAAAQTRAGVDRCSRSS